MWIARDKDGTLFVYGEEPIRYHIYFDSRKPYDSIMLDSKEFPEVTFENSPQEVELKLIDK